MTDRKKRNLIFDVGEVLLDYRWKEMLLEHGLSGERAERVGRLLFDDPEWSDHDRGIIGEEEMVRKLRDRYPDEADDIEWLVEEAAQMPVRRPAVYERMRELKATGHPIYLLSNYSRRFFELHTDGAPFMELIDGMVVSYMVHLVKPEPAIYRYLLDRYGLKAEDCVFFDDRAENIEAAREMGIEAHQVSSQKELLARLAAIS